MNSAEGRAVTVTPYTQFAANITTVATIGKEAPTGAEASRAGLILDAFKGSDSLLASPFVRKVFFPGYPLHTLKWPKLPVSQPSINFTYRQLNESQREAVERCLSNREEDRHVVIIVRSTSFSFPISQRASGAARDRKDYGDRRGRSEQGRGAQVERGLGHRTVKRRSQERCGEIGRFWIFGLQAPGLEGFPLRLVSPSRCQVPTH